MHSNHSGNRRSLRIAMLSIHSSPVGPLGTQDTGGMSVYVRELACWLGKSGHRVDIFTFVPGHDQILYPNVQLIHLADSQDQDIPKEQLPARLSDIFQRLDRFRRRNNCRYDLIHSHYWLSGAVGALAQARWRCPHVSMFHTLAMVKNSAQKNSDEPDLRIAHEQWLAKAADHIVVPCKREKDNLVHYYHARPERISMIPCGVNLELFRPIERFTARQQIGISAAHPVVLYVGRFSPLKGLDRLLEVMALLRNQMAEVQLIIIGGDGPNARNHLALNDIVRHSELESNVRFEGRLEQEQLPPYYSAADVLVVPSNYESFGLVTLEAMACGTPVVSTRVGAVETIIKQGINGSVTDSLDPGDLYKAIALMIKRSGEKTISQRNIRATVHGFAWQKIASAIVETYINVLDRYNPAHFPLVYEACRVLKN